VDKFREGIPCSSRRSCQGGIGRSEFSVENSRNSESRQILQRSREVMASILQVQAQERLDVGSKSTGVVGSLVNSHFGDSRVEGPKTLHQDS
jgi:hypothetical protein